jgi:trans-2,3-dihydro-3-hydroxyanthranilate isomerase
MASTYSFVTYDVFTDTRFAGNPLAVVFGADALSDAQMQAVAREFNLSETVFVCTATDARHTAEVRIFTPGKELPFAGHPTIGAAIAIYEARDEAPAKREILVLEEKVGPVRCAVQYAHEGASFAEFDAPKLSVEIGAGANDAAAAGALGLSIADIGFDRHIPSLYSAGVPFAMVPIASLDALARAWPAPGAALSQVFGAAEIYLYARTGAGEDHAFRARMFAPEIGIPEDPATGSAAAAFAGVLARFDNPPEEWSTAPILQGVEMGRPSLIGLEIKIENGALVAARIAGKAVKVSEGSITI